MGAVGGVNLVLLAATAGKYEPHQYICKLTGALKKNVPLKASLSSSIFLTNPSPSWILNILIHPRLVASSKANLGTFCTDHGLDRIPGPSGFAAPREARTGRLVENCRDTVGFRRIRAGAENDIVVCGSEDNEGGHKQPRKCKTRNDVQRKDPLLPLSTGWRAFQNMASHLSHQNNIACLFDLPNELNSSFLEGIAHNQ